MYLGRRTTVVTDYREPILGHGERALAAVELTDPQRVALTVDRVLATDPDRQQMTKSGLRIWTSKTNKGDGRRRLAVCVAQGCLIISDLELLIETLRRVE